MRKGKNYDNWYYQSQDKAWTTRTAHLMRKNFAKDNVPDIEEFIAWLEPDDDDDFETSACKSFLILFKEMLGAKKRIDELERKLT